jgi:carbon storage regulator CsrA
MNKGVMRGAGAIPAGDIWQRKPFSRQKGISPMLVLSRKTGERIRIGSPHGDIIITPTRIGPGDKVRIGIQAPPAMNIVREEVGPLRTIREQVGPMIAESPPGGNVSVPAPTRVPVFGPPTSSIRPLPPGYTVRQESVSPPVGVCFWEPEHGYWLHTFTLGVTPESRAECMATALEGVLQDVDGSEVRVVTFQEVKS